MNSLNYYLKKVTLRIARPFIFDSLSRIKEGDVVLDLPEFKGQFKMSAKSHIFKRFIIDDCFEPTTAALVQKYARGRDLIDVGANIGLFSVLFSHIASESKCKVLSIEPNTQALQYLRKNLLTNVTQNNNVVVFEGAATSEAKSYDFNFIQGMSEYSSIGEIIHPSVINEKVFHTSVKGDTLDSLVVKNKIQPGFIKIDVEGGERDVLIGAILTIEKYRPIILLEINDFNSLPESISPFYSDYFSQLSYTIFNHSLDKTKPPFIGDYICFPNEYIFD